MNSQLSWTLLCFAAENGLTFTETRDLNCASEFRVISAKSTPLDLSYTGHVDAILITLGDPSAQETSEDLIEQLMRHYSGVPIVVYHPGGSAKVGTTLMRMGAYYYLGHPAKREVLLEAVRSACQSARQQTEKVRDRSEGWRRALVGSSPAISEVVEIIHLSADSRSTVLISGETGTGKEVAAKAIHSASRRSQRPMVAINCAALPEHLLEAELFGHTKGAFTGASDARAGLFEKANHGTIFLDEIGEMSIGLQSKLLRVLQEREFHRIGSSEVVKIDVRVIAASNINLLEAVAARRFREDLYYRLNVVPLRIPSLRERLSDIPELVDFFLSKVASQEHRQRKQMSKAALQLLMSYSWPGNVRQLEHAIEAATIMSGSRPVLLPSDFRLPEKVVPVAEYSDIPEQGLNFESFVSNIEKQLLERALIQTGGNKARAAGLLNMKRTTLISKSKALQIA